MAKIILLHQTLIQIIPLSLHEISELFTERVLMGNNKIKTERNKNREVPFRRISFTIATHCKRPKFTAEKALVIENVPV